LGPVSGFGAAAGCCAPAAAELSIAANVNAASRARAAKLDAMSISGLEQMEVVAGALNREGKRNSETARAKADIQNNRDADPELLMQRIRSG
jgi:hypothetical protein